MAEGGAEALFERAAQLRYEAVKYSKQRAWDELRDNERAEWVDVMRTSAAALVAAKKQLSESGLRATP